MRTFAVVIGTFLITTVHAIAEDTPSSTNCVSILSQSTNGNFVLYVSNQSLDIDLIDITVKIDGKIAVQADFHVTGNFVPQHNWVKHIFRLPDGKHKLQVVSKKGEAMLEREFDIKGKHWAVVDYWYYPKSHYDPTPKQFSFKIQDKPIYFE